MTTEQDTGKSPTTARSEVSDTAKFVVAVGFLLLLVALGWLRDDSQYNMFFLTLLALACAMVFVYLPFTAQVDVGWFKAGSAAAIFGVVMWSTVPFAQEVKKANYKSAIDAQNLIIANLNKQQASLESQLSNALAARTAGEVCTAQASSLKQNISNAKSGVDQLKGSLGIVQNLLEAARGNSSDGATCSLRASQGLAELAKSSAALAGVVTAVSAVAISK